MKRIIASILMMAIMGALLPLFFARAHHGAHVVINEIKVGGEKATDEFVELYNPTDTDVNLAGWRLSKKTASGSLSNLLTEFPSLTILAHGYILIAHNDYAGNAPKDLSYSTQSSITADNTVILYSDNGQTIVDLVGMGSAGQSEGSTAPTPDAGMSIERVNGADTDNNAADFTVRTTPTPRQAPNGSPESTGGPTPPSPSSPTSITSPSPTITINEVLPNPTGNDEEGEWVELMNLGDQEVNLTDWAVEDASGKHYTIKQGAVISSTTIAPKGYFLLPRSATGISLNNTGTETLKLLSPSEQTIISTSYTGPAEEGQSWAKNVDGNFAWTTTPTPSASNVITPPANQENNKSIQQEINASNGTGVLPYAPTSPALSLVINELLPNPQGNDTTGEWIEINNEDNDEATLAGLMLSDESGASYTFTTQSKPIAPHGFLLLPRAQTKITLNNDGDTIFLKYKSTEIARASYGKSEEGMSFARDEHGNYAWTTTPTPGAANSFSLPQEVEEESEEEETPEKSVATITTQSSETQHALDAPVAPFAPSAKGVRTTTIDGARDLPRNTNVLVEGVIIAPPGVFGRTSFYLDGIQVYSVAIKFPDLTLGNRVQVQGYVSANGNEARITVPKTGLVKKLGEGEAPEPAPVTAETLGEEYEGRLVQVTGELMEKKGMTLWLDDDTGEVRIVLKESTGLSSEGFTTGERYTVKGVLSETSSGYRILPRGEDDVETKGAVLGESVEQSSAKGNNGRPVYYVITALAVMAVAGGLGWRKWRGHRQQQALNSKM